MSVKRIAAAVLGLTALLALSACDEMTPPSQDPNATPHTDGRGMYDLPHGSVLGDGGFDLLNLGGGNKENNGGNGIGVNSFLWRASLDTISFMPLASADPFGGVIITDWYSPPQSPKERFKLNVYILGRQLRADGVRVAVFRQDQNASGAWVDAPVAPKMKANLENEILTRARQLRFSSREAASQ